MSKKLLKDINDQTVIIETADMSRYQHLHDPNGIPGLHPEAHGFWERFMKHADLNNPYVKEMLDRVARGD